MKILAYSHRFALILAFLASIVVAAPQVYFRLDQAALYQGIELLPDSPWSARVREVIDGHPNFGNIYHKEGKEYPYLFQPLGSILVAYLGQTLALDINDTLLLSRLVGTFLLFLLIYIFLLVFARDKKLALAGTSVLLFVAPSLNFSSLSALFQGVSPHYFLTIARPVNPLMIYIFFFSFLTAFLLFWRTRKARWGVMSAVLLGLNFYAYFYSWTYLYAFGAIFGLLLLLRREYGDAVRVALVYVGALLVAVPWAVNMFQATSYPAYADAAMRHGVIHSREPLFVGFTVLTAITLYLLFSHFSSRGDRQTHAFTWALLLAPFITMNQQLLTGKVLQAGHYHWFFHKPIALIVTLVIGFSLLTASKFARYTNIIVILLISSSFALGIFVQAHSYHRATSGTEATAIAAQRYGPVMDWLSQHANTDEVVFANTETSYFVTIYTPLNVVYHRAGLYSLAVSKERLMETFFSFYRLKGVDAEEAHSVFFADRRLLSWTIYGIHYRELLGAPEAIPDEEITHFIAYYRSMLRTPLPLWLTTLFRRYDVSYVIWDTKEDSEWNLEQLPFLKEEVELGEFKIYRVLQ